MPSTPRLPAPRLAAVALALLALVTALAVAGCGGSSADAGAEGKIAAVGAENEYADVIEQIGGRYVDVSAVESDPNTDPHTFEASAGVARQVADAEVVVQNGLGYDTYMEKIESASPSSQRKVIDVQELLGLPDSTANPHLWYKPETMPAVARRLVADFAELQPGHRAYFAANLSKFEASLRPWLAHLEEFDRKFPGATVATTEPVADYMLEAAGIENLTPFTMQADIMNDTDPAPQAVAMQEGFFADKQADAFVYNQQVTDSITGKFLGSAAENDVPVVGVYETMPSGYTYQRWMMAELKALEEAVADGKSTEGLR
ncbi:MAG TPA: zinc ABC transporter substrate-binding protein [Solirubrobacterales bacterium]|nr:zinc ABC transporter substrate-binding protein [Solirubrobacterales bacterium]